MASTADADPNGAAQSWQAAAQSVVRPKMDMAKALAIMGFSSSRTLDPNGGHDPRKELSEALSRQMALIDRKKNARSQRQNLVTSQVESQLSRQKDDVRMLHEAYQFLSRKYLAPSKVEEEENYGISAMGAMEASMGSGHNFLQ